MSNKLNVVAFSGTNETGRPSPISLGSLDGHRWLEVHKYPATAAELWSRINEAQAADILIIALDKALLESGSKTFQYLKTRLDKAFSKLASWSYNDDLDEEAAKEEEQYHARTKEEFEDVQELFQQAYLESQPLFGTQHANSIFSQRGTKSRLIIFVIPHGRLQFPFKDPGNGDPFKSECGPLRQRFGFYSFSDKPPVLLKDLPPTKHPNLDRWKTEDRETQHDTTWDETAFPIIARDIRMRREGDTCLGFEFSYDLRQQVVIIPEVEHWHGEGGSISSIVANFLTSCEQDHFTYGWKIVKQALDQSGLELIGCAASWQLCCIETYLAARQADIGKSGNLEAAQAIKQNDEKSPASSTDEAISTSKGKPAQKARAKNATSVTLGWNHFILIGTTGTGKEGLANFSHSLKRKGSKLVSLNCSAISESLAQAELFGCKKGSHNTAHSDRDGLIKAAGSGTLFLDEFQDLVQAGTLRQLLLRFLQEGTYIPVGADIEVESHARVVAATNALDLLDVSHRMYTSGLLPRFSSKVRVPNLLERWSDVPLIVRHYVGTYSRTKEGKLSPDAMDDVAKQIVSQLKPADVHREGVRALTAAVSMYMQVRRFSRDVAEFKRKELISENKIKKNRGGRPPICDDLTLIQRLDNLAKETTIDPSQLEAKLGYKSETGLRDRLVRVSKPQALSPDTIEAYMSHFFPGKRQKKGAAQ